MSTLRRLSLVCAAALWVLSPLCIVRGASVGLSFEGGALADQNWFPPSPTLGVGPTQVVVATSGKIRSFNKTTGVADGALDVAVDAFFASVMTPVTGAITSCSAEQVHVRYDRLTSRWFITAVDFPIIAVSPVNLAPNRTLIAVSSGPAITGADSFTFFQFQHDTVNLADEPSLGIDAHALYIGVDMYTPAYAFAGTNGYVVQKSSLLGSGPIVVTKFPLLTSSSGAGIIIPRGVDNDDPTATEGYFVGVDNLSFSKLVFRRVSDPGSSAPTISSDIALTVGTTSYPVPVEHLGNIGGTNGRLGALDDRLFAAQMRNGRLWTAQNILVTSAGAATSAASTGRTGIRWYEFGNLTTTPAAIQSGTVFDSATNRADARQYLIPTVAVTGQGHAVLAFTTAGAPNYIDAGFVSRLGTDAAGTMSALTRYTASATAYNPAANPGSSSGRRWGNYSATCVDSSDDMTVWTVQEYCNATDSYAVQVARILAPPPAAPTSCSTSVAAGASDVDVIVTGTSASGAAFYNPDTSFANHLAASVSGTGVTVNSVTYTDATHATLNLSVALAATPGTRSITITNPDGQSATSASAILTIDAPPAPTVTGVSPTSGDTSGGTTVTITGTSFANVTAVTFGGSAASSFTVDSGTQITAVAPTHAAATVDIVVTTMSGTSPTSSADQFTFATIPAVTALSATELNSAGGAVVTLTGTHFTGTTAVKFGNVDAASFTVVSDTEISAVVPGGLAGAAANVTVTTSEGTSSTGAGNAFNYATVPAIASPSSTAVLAVSATLGGHVTGDGFSVITARGIVLSVTSTNSAPALGDADVIELTSSGTTGVFSVNATDLTPHTQYSFRAYATNAIGTTYSETGTFSTVPAVAAGQLIISEFRLRGNGPSSSNNEYVEIYNPGTADVTVATTDGSAGFALRASNDSTVFVIPNGTVIPAHGHYLGVNSGGYSWNSYPAGAGTAATGDITWTTDIPDNSGLALFNSAAEFTTDTRLDAAGFTTSAALYREGAGIPVLNNSFAMDCALYRFHLAGTAGTNDPSVELTDGQPRDTGNNSLDFAFVDTNGTSAGAGQRLGAPGPKNLSSPIALHPATRNIGRALLDTTTTLGASPNRVRDQTSDPAHNATFGTMLFQRTFTNNTGAPLTRLRFRIVKLTTFPAPGGISDLRPMTSIGGTVTTDGGEIAVQGTTLERADAQLNGGGWNSTFSADAVSAANPLANGASINLRFEFGIQQTGTYRFALLAETLPGSAHFWIVEGDTENSAVETEDALRAPSVTTASVAGLAGTSVSLGGNVTSAGGTALSERGIVYALTSANSNPQLDGPGVTKIADLSATTGVFTVNVSGLTAGAAYSFAAYATNSLGTSYTSVGTFTTLSSNANLSALTASNGTLSPAFTSGGTSYSVTVPNAIASLTLTPTAANAAATVRVDGETVVSGSASNPISLNVGANTITVVVVAEDGSTTKTYTVTVTRVPRAPAVTQIAPAAGGIAGGTAVTLTGTNFSGTTAVLFGATSATAFTVDSATQITATAPAHNAGSVNVTVTTSGGTSATSAGNVFTYTLPVLSIDDVSHVEGDSGTTTFRFTVGLSAPAPAGGVTFDIATADGTATGDSDYVAKSLTSQTIPAGSSSYTFDVLVSGDSSIEGDETFFVNVTNVAGATVGDGQGKGTITNDDSLDMAVTLTGSPNPVAAGANATYTITAANGGTAPAPDASMSFSLPSNTTFVSTSAPAGWSMTTPAVGGTGTISASHVSLAAGADALFTVVVQVSAAVADGTVLTATAGVSAGGDDANLANNAASATTTVQTSADLAVLLATPEAIGVGGNLSYTITVTNNGPSAAAGVALVHALSTGAGFTSSTASQGSFNPANNSWTVGTLSSGASATLQMTVAVSTMPVGGRLAIDSGTLSATTSDPDVENNSASGSLAILSNDADLAGLALSAGTLSPVFATGTTSYTASVAYGVSSLTLTATSADPGATIRVNGTEVASGSTSGSLALAVGDSPITILVTAEDGTTTKAYVVTVTRAAAVADLELTLAQSPNPAPAAGTATYTLTVTNHGPDPALGALFATIRGNQTFASVNAPAGWSIFFTPEVGSAGDLLIGADSDADPIASGDSVAITLTTNVTATTQGARLELYGVTLSSGSDPDLSNNERTLHTLVGPSFTPANATPLANVAVGARVTGNLAAPGQVNAYSFTAHAGDRVYAATATTASSDATNASRDTVLRLVAADGHTVIELDDDDGGLSSTSSSIAGATIPADGTYYLLVDCLRPEAIVFPYDLYVRVHSGAPGAEAVYAATPDGQIMPDSDWIAGTTSSGDEVDRYTIALGAGDTIFASLDLDPARAHSDWDGKLTLRRVGADPVESFAMNGSDLVSKTRPNSEALMVTVKETGNYVLEVSSADGTTHGDYRLSVTMLPAPAENTSTTYAATIADSAIPDGGTLVSTLTIPARQRIGKLKVALNLTHANLPDLDVHLTAPGGNTIGLFRDVSDASHTTLDAIFDDDAAYAIGFAQDDHDNPMPTVTGAIFKPGRGYRLGWFAGEEAQGTWTLTIRDRNANAASGTLNSWSLTVLDDDAAPAGVRVDHFSMDFETTDGGFTHSGTDDQWSHGAPSAAPIATAHSGAKAWKTNLAGSYESYSNQDLVSPDIDLTDVTDGELVELTWAMSYQLADASTTSAYVFVEEVGGDNASQVVWRWLGPTMRDTGVGADALTIDEAAGWGVHRALISNFAGKTIRLRFHVETHDAEPLAGLAIDDVAVSSYRAPATDATLSGLALSAGTLAPTFASETTGYTATVDYATSSLTVTPTTTDAHATVTVNGATIASGSASASIPLSVGDNTLAVIVTAEDGATTKTYTAIVTRLPATPVITNADLTASGTYGSAITVYTITASNTPTSFSVSGLPPGLTVDSATGAITGTPTSTGAFDATIRAINAGGTGSATLTFTIGRAAASIALGNLSATYDGSAKNVAATTTPSDLTVSVTYDGSATPPTNVGTYAVVATIADANYAGTQTGTLTIGKATASIALDHLNATYDGSAKNASATTTPSGLAMNLTYNGSSTAPTNAGSYAVVATVTNANYVGTQNGTLVIAKASQAIAFSAIDDPLAIGDQVTLVATASSGLPVTFAVVSGPGQLAGATLTVTGSGTIVVRAEQSGNGNYLAAEAMMQSAEATARKDRVFFGRLSSTTTSTNALRRTASAERATAGLATVGDIAAFLPAESSNGTLLIVAPLIGINQLVPFTLASDGTFTLNVTQTLNDVTQSVTGRGSLVSGVLSGTFDTIGLSFSTSVEPAAGPSADVQGLYRSTALDAAQGTTYTMIGANDNVLVLVVTPSLTVGGMATLEPDGTFSLQTDNVTVAGVVDVASTAVSSTVTIANIGQAPTTIGFGGLKTTTARTDRLINLSSRARVSSGENLLISGFVIGGSTPKPVLVRAVGPSLAPLGVQTPLANPRIQIVRNGEVVASNDDWSSGDAAGVAATASRVGAFALAPGSADAALQVTLAPGVYTALVSGTGGDGVALAEVYDASENPQNDYQRLINISARGEVGSGENVLIGGWAITGNAPKRVLVRGVGPALAGKGVAHPLADPVLRVFKGSAPLAENDNWSADATAANAIAAAAEQVGAFALPSGNKDAAILLTLAPGYYTVHIGAAANAGNGVALVEIYEIPEE